MAKYEGHEVLVLPRAYASSSYEAACTSVTARSVATAVTADAESDRTVVLGRRRDRSTVMSNPMRRTCARLDAVVQESVPCKYEPQP